MPRLLASTFLRSNKPSGDLNKIVFVEGLRYC